jgi:hypothetical protein
MNLLPPNSAPAPWSGIIAATCVLLFLLQQMLFLAILPAGHRAVLHPATADAAPDPHGHQPERRHPDGGQQAFLLMLTLAAMVPCSGNRGHPNRGRTCWANT